MTTQQIQDINFLKRESKSEGRYEGAIWTLGGVIIALVILAIAIT